jgi:hypothetical protein
VDSGGGIGRKRRLKETKVRLRVRGKDGGCGMGYKASKYQTIESGDGRFDIYTHAVCLLLCSSACLRAPERRKQRLGKRFRSGEGSAV